MSRAIRVPCSVQSLYSAKQLLTRRALTDAGISGTRSSPSAAPTAPTRLSSRSGSKTWLRTCPRKSQCWAPATGTSPYAICTCARHPSSSLRPHASRLTMARVTLWRCAGPSYGLQVRGVPCAHEDQPVLIQQPSSVVDENNIWRPILRNKSAMPCCVATASARGTSPALFQADKLGQHHTVFTRLCFVIACLHGR